MSSRPERGGSPKAAKARGVAIDGVAIDEGATYRQMAIVEKYERFIEYMYPIIQNCPRKHGVARDKILHAMFDQVDLFIVAGRSSAASRVYAADANLQYLRFWLRFIASSKRRIITPNQHRVAEGHLEEVGNMTGAWVKSVKGGG